MIVNFANIDLSEQPILILKNAGGTPLGILGYAKDVDVDLKYNEVSTIEFDMPAYVDGEKTPFYDDLVGMRTIELQSVGQFTLQNPSDDGDGIRKTKKCKAYSLEYEFAYKKISIPEGTYRFWDSMDAGNTVLGMIMELMPSWHVGTIDGTIANRYRTFEINNENIYNFMKGTLQETYNCIFIFDTMTRTVSVRNCDDVPLQKAVFISHDNLATEIKVEEKTEDVITRLDVNGADGVDIRDVNPCGTNRIIDLSYFMTPDNFSQELITKYNAWKTLCENNREIYYSLSVQYAMKAMQIATENAKLTDLKGELTSLENVQAVAIQSIAQGLATQDALDAANANITAKNTEIAAKVTEIAAIQTAQAGIYTSLTTIKNACDYESYFTASEKIELDRYMKDGEISDGTFVMVDASNYTDEAVGAVADGKQISITDAEVQEISGNNGSLIYVVRGGTISCNLNNFQAKNVSATLEIHTDASFIFSAYLNRGTIGGQVFPSGCISFTGKLSTHYPSATSLSAPILNGYCYFSLDASEYERRSVAWDLYEYGETVLSKLSQPSYTFSVTSANFFSLDEFKAFKNAIEMGEKIYVQTDEDTTLKPILIGVHFKYDDLKNLTLQFSDTYTSSDSTFRLVDLLEQSVSMGKNLELSKYVYSSFVDSGARNGVRDFMDSALDVAKNAVLSSTEQAISWDGAGFRLRRWADQGHTTYEPEQIWMINNSIVMTDDGWQTAKLAIGKFHDENLGDCWGIVAPMIAGTLLMGEELIIESSKKDENGVSVFRVNADGVRLYNGDLSVIGGDEDDPIRAHIALNPDLGIIIGTYPAFTVSDDGEITISENNAKFWVDTDGNVHFRGTLHGTNGEFTGSVTATSLTIKDMSNDEEIYVSADEYVTSRLQPISQNLDDFIDTMDGNVTIWYTDTNTAPANPDVKDLWYDRSTGKVWRYETTGWVEITDTPTAQLVIAADDAQATADGKIRTFSAALNGAMPPTQGMTAKDEGDLFIVTDDNNKMYRWNGTAWVSIRDNHLDYLIDGTDGVVTIWYTNDATTPANPQERDIWYDRSTGRVKRYIDSTWVDITNTPFAAVVKSADSAQATADQKIVTFAQPNMPTATDVGDLWIDTDDDNKLYRWNGTTWIPLRDGTIAAAQTTADNAQTAANAASLAAQNARAFANQVYNGEQGIYFTNSSVGTVTVNNQVGLKIVGTDSSYFQVKNNAMGFFDSNNNGMLYYENGNMVLRGVISALGGYIGGTNGWVIGEGCIYNNEIYLGVEGSSMANLSVTESFQAPNVAEKYIGKASVTIGANGDYLTLQAFANAINNHVVPGNVTATLYRSTTENVTFCGITGAGQISIIGNGYTVTGNVTFTNNSSFIAVHDVTMVGSTSVTNCQTVGFYGVTFDGNAGSIALLVQLGSAVNIGRYGSRYTYFYNATSLITVQYASQFSAYYTGGGNCTCFLEAARSTIYMQGSRPDGNMTASYSVYPVDPSTLPIDYGTATPQQTTPTQTTTTASSACTLTATHTFHSAYGSSTGSWWNDNRLRQGFVDMGTTGKRQVSGCMWFTMPSVSANSIQKAVLTLTRISGYGGGYDVDVRLLWTSISTYGSGQYATANTYSYGVIGTIANGETKDFEIPVAAVQRIINYGGGLMLQVTDNSLRSGKTYSNNYAHFYGYGEDKPPVLTLTY